MENNEELVNETENVELTTEEIEDVETPEEEPKEELQEPVEEMIPKSKAEEMVKKRLLRQENKLRKEYAKKYGRLETVVNAGLGTESTEEAVNKLTEFYESKGINIPNEPRYSDRDLEVLASAEADEIISSGYDDIVEEVDRLAQLDVNSMSQREKLVFTKLANARKSIEEEKELASIGVSKEDLESEEFKEFIKDLNPSLTLKRKYELYQKNKPKEEIKQIGSLQSGKSKDVKEYYSDKEISNMTLDDLDNDEVWEAVRKSMTK
jgi:exonuclease VII large subunit